MFRFCLTFLFVISIAVCFIEPPTQLAVFQRVLSSFKFPPAQISSLHDSFIKVDSDQGRWNAIKQFLTKVPAAKQPAVKAILLELMDNVYLKFLGMSQGEVVLGMTSANKLKFSAKYAALDKQYKGDDSIYLSLLLKDLVAMYPPNENAALWKKFNAWAATPLIKTAIAKNHQFFHWDGKSKAVYFYAKGYKRSKAAWEAKVKE